MPDASGAFKGISVPADAWERIFGEPWTPETTSIDISDLTPEQIAELEKGVGLSE